MKKIIAAVTLLAIAGANITSARAGDREWATVGKVLTGVAAGVFIANAIDCQPASYSVTYSSYSPAPTYCPPPAPVYCPPPVPVCAPRVVYVPAPPPVVVYQAPVYYAPRPYANMNFRYGGGYRHHHRGNPHGR